MHGHIHQFLYFDTLHLENQMKLVRRFQRFSKLNYLHFYLLNIAHFHFYGRRNFCQIKKRNSLYLPCHCSCIMNLTLTKEGGVNFFNPALSCIDNWSIWFWFLFLHPTAPSMFLSGLQLMCISPNLISAQPVTSSVRTVAPARYVRTGSANSFLSNGDPALTIK